MKTQKQMTLLWVIAVTIEGAIAGYLEGSYFQFSATLVFFGLLFGTAQYMVLRQASGLGILCWMPIFLFKRF